MIFSYKKKTNNKFFNSNQHEYLLTCDLINKYCLKHVSQKPKIEELRISDDSSHEYLTFDRNLKAKKILFFNLVFGLWPNFSIKRSQSIRITSSFEIRTSNIEAINLLLISILKLNNFANNSFGFPKKFELKKYSKQNFRFMVNKANFSNENKEILKKVPEFLTYNTTGYLLQKKYYSSNDSEKSHDLNNHDDFKIQFDGSVTNITFLYAKVKRRFHCSNLHKASYVP